MHDKTLFQNQRNSYTAPHILQLSCWHRSYTINKTNMLPVSFIDRETDKTQYNYKAIKPPLLPYLSYVLLKTVNRFSVEVDMSICVCWSDWEVLLHIICASRVNSENMWFSDIKKDDQFSYTSYMIFISLNYWRKYNFILSSSAFKSKLWWLCGKHWVCGFVGGNRRVSPTRS